MKQHHALPEETDKGLGLEVRGFQSQELGLFRHSSGAKCRPLAASQAPLWVGQLAAALAFLLVGMGIHTTQTAGLALATDLAPAHTQAKVVGLMYVMQLVGMMVSAVVFGDLLSNYSPGRLIQVIQAAAILTLVLNVVALW